MVTLDPQGMRSRQCWRRRNRRSTASSAHLFLAPRQPACSARAWIACDGDGHRLAQEHPVDADVVISVPDSSNSSALGYAEESGIPFELGLIRNHYIGRTFIQPRQDDRDAGVRIKFNPVREVLEGRRVVVVDDSIVRGTTSRKLVRVIRHAGAREVHFRVGSPPVTHPCFYGIDTPSRGELIGALKTVQEIGDYLGVNSLGYISLDGLLACERDGRNFCHACFSGRYPVPVDPSA
jgi:amidophosphoribosyltransferase